MIIQKDGSLAKLLMLSGTKNEIKKMSVKKSSESLDQMREVAKKLEEVLSPKKTKHAITNYYEIESPQPGDARIINIFEARIVNGDRIDFKNLSVVNPIRSSEYADEYLVRDDSDHYMRKKIINIDRLEKIFGVDMLKVQDLLKIYMSMSSYLPDIYFAAVQKRELSIYMTYYR